MRMQFNKTKSVCAGCEKRYVGCHSLCDAYKAEKEEVEAEKAKAYAEKKKIAEYGGYVRTTQTKILREMRYKR